MGQPRYVGGGGGGGTVYPHVCGATPGVLSVTSITSGLSPRVWGNHLPEAMGRDKGRSIPTCVGQPSCRQSRPQSLEVYPHVCGATAAQQAFDKAEEGLSPRVWGNQEGEDEERRKARSIPTCVGQPIHRAITQPMRGVYPHVCGATEEQQRADVTTTGLSPRVWGNPPPSLHE